MRSSLRFFLLTACLLSIVCIAPSPMTAQESESTPVDNEEEVVQRILDLRQQIEDLLEILPEEVRQEVEQRWRKRQEVADGPLTQETTGSAAPATEVTSVEPPAVEEEIEPEAEIGREVVEAAVPPCGGFHLFDTNEDSLISGSDRLWRFFRLWFDDNDDGTLQESEIVGLYENGVRQIDVELRFYTNDDGDSEDVDVDEVIWLRAVGNQGSQRRSGVLVVEGDRLIRDGRLWLTDADGTPLSGVQTLAAETHLEDRDGNRSPVLCGQSEQTNLN